MAEELTRGCDSNTRRDRQCSNDLGFPDSAELTVKTILAKKLNEIIDSRRLTQNDAPELLGLPQTKLSAIRDYRLRGISLERLMRALAAMGSMSRSSSVARQKKRRQGSMSRRK